MLKTIKKDFAHGKNFLIFSILKVLGQALFAVLPLIFAYFLSPEGFGAYSLSIMIIYLFTILLVSSSTQPFVVYANEELKKTNKISKTITTRLVLLAISTVVFFILAFAFAGPISKFASLSRNQFYLLLLAYLGVGIKYFFESLFLGLNQRNHHAVYELLTAFFSILIVIYFYYFSTINLENIFIMLFVAPIIAFLFMSFAIDYSKLFPLKFNKTAFRSMLDYTKWMLLGNTSVYIVNWGDNLVLRYFVSLKEIGIYNLGYQVLKGLIMLSVAVNLYFLPFISQQINNKTKIRDYLYKKRPKIFLLGLAGIIALYFMLPHFINLIYGDNYKESVTVARILLIAAVFVLYREFYSPIFSTLRQYRFIQTALMVFAALNIILDFFLVAWIGFIGAAVATTIAFLFSTITYEWYFRKYCKDRIL